MKPVREPDAGDPHVRFDERRGETGWQEDSVRKRAKADSAAGSDLPNGTAPHVDSTRQSRPMLGFCAQVRLGHFQLFADAGYERFLNNKAVNAKYYSPNSVLIGAGLGWSF